MRFMPFSRRPMEIDGKNWSLKKIINRYFLVFLSNKTWEILLTFVRHVFNLSNQVFNIQFLKTFKNLSKFLFILLQSQFRQSGTSVMSLYLDFQSQKLSKSAIFVITVKMVLVFLITLILLRVSTRSREASSFSSDFGRCVKFKIKAGKIKKVKDKIPESTELQKLIFRILFVKLCLHSSYRVQNFFHFDEFYKNWGKTNQIKKSTNRIIIVLIS